MKQDLAMDLSPITLGKGKRKKQLREVKDRRRDLKEKFGILYGEKEEKPLKNLLFMEQQKLEKRDENFFMVINEEKLVKI